MKRWYIEKDWINFTLFFTKKEVQLLEREMLFYITKKRYFIFNQYLICFKNGSCSRIWLFVIPQIQLSRIKGLPINI